MQLLLLGINGLLLMLIWHFILRRSILDHHRDQLFDLRDQLRKKFVENNWSLDLPLYRHMRDLINGYLRFTEFYSFSEFVKLESEMTNDEKLRATLKSRVTKQFNTDIEEQRRYVAQFRKEAVNIMMNYMIVSSGPLLILSITIIPFVFIYAAFRKVKMAGLSLFGKAIQVQEVFGALVRLTLGLVASKFLVKDFVEEYSYRQAC